MFDYLILYEYHSDLRQFLDVSKAAGHVVWGNGMTKNSFG